jgi:protein-S-isoprenylcysteine O-methyltransferase Ste14
MYGRGERVFAWSLVGLQLILLVGLVALPGCRVWPGAGWVIGAGTVAVAVAAAVAVAGALRLGSGLTASPLPSPGAPLRTAGVYACVRHPIYSALLLGGAGVVAIGGRVSRAWVWLALLGLLWFKARLQERKLAARFPGYRSYAAGTPRFVPHPLRCWSRLRATRRPGD